MLLSVSKSFCALWRNLFFNPGNPVNPVKISLGLRQAKDKTGAISYFSVLLILLILSKSVCVLCVFADQGDPANRRGADSAPPADRVIQMNKEVISLYRQTKGRGLARSAVGGQGSRGEAAVLGRIHLAGRPGAVAQKLNLESRVESQEPGGERPVTRDSGPATRTGRKERFMAQVKWGRTFCLVLIGSLQH